jgi:hypothetical protein
MGGLNMRSQVSITVTVHDRPPFATQLRMCFLDKPRLDYVLKPLNSFDATEVRSLDLSGLNMNPKYMVQIITHSTRTALYLVYRFRSCRAGSRRRLTTL